MTNNEVVNCADSFWGVTSYSSQRVTGRSAIYDSQIIRFADFEQRFSMFIDLGVIIFFLLLKLCFWGRLIPGTWIQ